MHWACKRGYEDVVRILMNSGADKKVQNFKGETPVDLCSNTLIFSLLGEPNRDIVNNHTSSEDLKFVPNYLKNPPLSPAVHSKHTVFTNMPTTVLPAQTDIGKIEFVK